MFDELEESLIMADLGVETTLKIIENLKKRVKKERAEDPSLIKGMLQDEIAEILSDGEENEFKITPPSVILVIGVNGVGKTTTIGKPIRRFFLYWTQQQDRTLCSRQNFLMK